MKKIITSFCVVIILVFAFCMVSYATGNFELTYTKADGTFSLQQGMVEMSNANTINEMLNSINVSRGYEAMSKLLKNQSDTVQQAISLGNISR